MKNVPGMLISPATVAMWGPIDGGMIWMIAVAIASTILVPERIPVKMPAAKIRPDTASAFPACAAMRSFCWMSDG